jgi:hypothetical protein
LPELAESVPIDGIPQLRPLQYQLRHPYISRRSPETFTAQSHFAFPELSRLVCSLLVAILLTGCSDLLSFFSLIISQVPLLARCTSLPVFPFSQTNLCFIPFLEFVLFVFPIRPPAHPAFLYAQAQPARLHRVGSSFSLASVQYSYLPPLPMTSQHSVVLRVISCRRYTRMQLRLS